jgi:hypothetical protein
LSRFLRICNQSFKKVLIRAKKNFFPKNSIMGIKKRRISRWFRICWKRFEKMHQKKLLAKTWQKYALFSLLLMFVKLVLLITFFCVFFNNSFNGFEISVFWHLLWFFIKKFKYIIIVLFSNFEAKRAKNSSKNQKTYLVNVSRFQFCTHQRVCILHFIKKNQIRCTLLSMAALFYSTSCRNPTIATHLLIVIIFTFYNIYVSGERLGQNSLSPSRKISCDFLFKVSKTTFLHPAYKWLR